MKKCLIESIAAMSMHVTKMDNWQALSTKVDKYFEKYEGYISSHDYKRADDEALAKLAERIRS